MDPRFETVKRVLFKTFATAAACTTDWNRFASRMEKEQNAVTVSGDGHAHMTNA